jgi:hypothetical protein
MRDTNEGKMTEKRSMIQDNMMIPWSDLPPKKDIEAAAARLLSDYKILASYHIDAKREEAEQFKSVVSLLEMIVSKYRK